MGSEFPAAIRRFVVFEGVDGAGTTTQLRLAGEALSRAGIPHWTTCEPTARPEGALIRRILGGGLVADPGTVAYLFAADRHEHLHGTGGMLERLGRGEIVICDRYVLSSLAYQGASCGEELPAALNARFPLPELLVYFDVDPSVSMGRVGKRVAREIYEELGFQERVRAAYEGALARYADSGMRVVRVDAGAGLAEVASAVLRALSEVALTALAPPPGATE
jgi:dTMP kinase